jgi:hypothetical protein
MSNQHKITDVEVLAYINQPRHRLFANKLWFAEQMGYKCGPRGVPVPEPGQYVVRPIYNLQGMGLGASIEQLYPDSDIPLGYFWCELFEGDHYTADWVKQDGEWVQCSTFKGIRNTENLYKFERWHRINIELPLTHICANIDADVINVEYIGNKPIEVHIRQNPNPVEYDELRVVWYSTPHEVWGELQDAGYNFIPAYQNIGIDARLGFFVKGE